MFYFKSFLKIKILETKTRLGVASEDASSVLFVTDIIEESIAAEAAGIFQILSQALFSWTLS